MTKKDLKPILIEALKYYGGAANIIEVCQYIWDHYEQKLRKSGNLFFTWQYDVRWAATTLRRDKTLKPAGLQTNKRWELIDKEI
ncbi:hypothetical protein HYN59_06380 [Flavobacterium album]|uniref:Uncharacterized protein n=1 Tax=Flavobacterium album TaxID=2175091 RepID=A0A2S1QWI7_9FLAO|nr:hypothetical protein [Flavobacterium album]AWH84772.1 hypothetical protein HYN59_06380 [Flavobacterium album]